MTCSYKIEKEVRKGEGVQLFVDAGGHSADAGGRVPQSPGAAGLSAGPGGPDLLLLRRPRHQPRRGRGLHPHGGPNKVRTFSYLGGGLFPFLVLDLSVKKNDKPHEPLSSRVP